jgi:hypothetical protein
MKEKPDAYNQLSITHVTTLMPAKPKALTPEGARYQF